MEPFKTEGFFDLPVSTYSPTFGSIFGGSALDDVQQPIKQSIVYPVKPEENQEAKSKESKPVEKTEVKKVEKKEEKSREEHQELKEFFWETSSPIELSPIFGATRSALGLSVHEADSNSIADIGKAVATLTQTEDPRKIFSYIAKLLTRMPANVSSPVHFLHKKLTYDLADFMQKRGGKK